MPKRTSAADRAPPMRVVLLTMDHHLASAALRAHERIVQTLPTLSLGVHTAATWRADAQALQQCRDDIARADLVIVSMLFMEDHFLPVLADLQAKRSACDAMVCIMSAPEVMALTRMGRYEGGGQSGGLISLLRKLRPQVRRETGSNHNSNTAGAKQMAMLRRLPKLLRLIPGTAQDLRVFFLVMRYWLAGSEDNLSHMVQLLVQKYAQGPREVLRDLAQVRDPLEYPEVGLYHPKMKSVLSDQLRDLPSRGNKNTPCVGLLLLRSYLLSGNTAHYDAVITTLEAKGLRVIPAYASGLDARPAIERFFMRDGQPQIDALLSLTGFSLVGGPAYNDAHAAQKVLADLDVPYLSAHPLEFQSIDAWANDQRGLLPVESTIMVAIPELDGATTPMVFAGRAGPALSTCQGCERACVFGESTRTHDMFPCAERIDLLSERVQR